MDEQERPQPSDPTEADSTGRKEADRDVDEGWPVWLCETVNTVHEALDCAETAAKLGTMLPDSLTANSAVDFAWVASVDGTSIRARSAPATTSLPSNLAANSVGTLTERVEYTGEVQTRTDSTPEDSRLALGHAGEVTDTIESFVGVPLRADGVSYGVLHLYLDVEEPNFESVLSSLGRTLGRQFRAFETAEQLARERRRLESTRSLLSHDLGNPLNIASGRIELARADDDTSHLDSVDGALEQVDTLLERGVRLVEVGQRPVEREKLSLAELARDSWDDVGEQRGELVVEEATLLGERERVRMLLNELVRNAFVHSEGPVTVEIGPLSGLAGFYVEDDGPGVPDEDREYVLDTGYTTLPDREGLDLSIVAEIAGAHGWDVAVEPGEPIAVEPGEPIAVEPGEPSGARVEIVTSRW